MTQERTELSFDGHGINGPDEYRSRIATFQNGQGEKYGLLFERAPQMLQALLYADEALCAATFAKGADQSQLNHAIKLVREARKGLEKE